jgi:hypothetical protein
MADRVEVFGGDAVIFTGQADDGFHAGLLGDFYI